MMKSESRRSRSRSRERDENGLGGGSNPNYNNYTNNNNGGQMQQQRYNNNHNHHHHHHSHNHHNNHHHNNSNHHNNNGGGGGGGPSMLLSAQQVAQDKINRELFVGNTPPGTSEMLLLQFLNGGMRRVGLCQSHETPILNCRVNTKFAFIELVNSEMANRALNLNGIPFLGAVLKVSRPSKYSGPPMPARTWQELTGQSLPQGIALDAEQEKVNRELFIGNTTPEMTEQMLKDFLGNAMEQVGLAALPGNPITACRVSGKFAFIELRSPQEAANALNLNNIPFLGTQLRVGRPSKWNGPPDSHGNWEDILAKYMSGELQLGQNNSSSTTTTNNNNNNNSNNTTTTTNNNNNNNNNSNQSSQTTSGSLPNNSPQQQPFQSIHATTNTSATRVVELKNMLTLDDLNNEEEYNDILEDTKEECSQFGQLLQVVIPKAGQVGAEKVFLEYTSNQEAAKAIQALAGRTFDGRRVEAAYFDEIKFTKQQYE